MELRASKAVTADCGGCPAAGVGEAEEEEEAICSLIGPNVSSMVSWVLSAAFMDSSRVFVMGAVAPRRQIWSRVVHSAQALASVFAENWPAAQTGHAAFFVVPEALKPWPGGHVHVSEAQSVS